MHKQVTDTRAMYTRVETMHRVVYGLLIQVRDELRDAELSQGDRVDLSFLLREMAKMFKDLEKESRLLRENNDNIVCFKAISSQSVENIKGEIATGTPQVKTTAKLPSRSRDPEAFYQLMEDLGVPPESVAQDAVRPHYPGMLELISQRVADGKNPPRGIDPTTMHPTYTLTLRKKAGVDV